MKRFALKRPGFRGFLFGTQRMKPSSMIVVGAALVLAMAACQEGNKKPQNASARNRFGYQGTGNAETAVASPTPTPDPNATPKPESQPTPASSSSTTLAPTSNPTPPAREMAYGTPVPGKPGFVTSPHMPYAGYVDVRGFPPGTEVKCPYSGKIFLVP